MSDDLRPPPESARLLPCPFCGGEAQAQDKNGVVFYAFCKKCGASTGNERCHVDAIDAWNRRGALPEDAGQVERVARALAAEPLPGDYDEVPVGEVFTRPRYQHLKQGYERQARAALKALSDA